MEFGNKVKDLMIPATLSGRDGVKKRMALLVFEQAQMLDVAGPADVFAMAERFAPGLRYELRCVSARGGPLRLSNGLSLLTEPLSAVRLAGLDTLLVAGAERKGLQAALADQALGQWVQRAAARVQRLVSVCVGSYALAHWGLLDGRRATSHWSVLDRLQRDFPKVQVERDALFVRDGELWTAGGVSTGIDLSLALLEQDSNRRVAAQVARALVMASRRVGNQSQYSLQLRAQGGRYAELSDWMATHLRERLDIATLAARAGETERSFCRHFSAEVGEPPGRFVESLRVDAARRALEGGASAKAAARQAGFGAAEQMSRAFRRRLDMTPRDYQRQHGDA